ncbi:MAG: glycoside hydrolase family 16 protein [Clostridia bacterium]|nr:glycoside hydrolase family 16 protein [Clostridia bacterium]
MDKWRRIVAITLGLGMVAALAGCDGGKPDEGKPDDGDPQPPPEEQIEPVDYGWNSAPVVTGTFYDDFSGGIDTDVWASDDRGWGLDKTNNNGVTSKNILYSTNRERVEAEGAKGGIVAMKATGAYSTDPYKGAVLITRDSFGAGKYEVRLKVLPRQGQCTALWTYWNGTPNLTTGDSLEDSKYSEIDIELPEGGDFRQFSATTYSKYINKQNMDQTTAKVSYEKAGLGNMSVNDGEWHTLAFEWRTAENDTGIIWYVDGQSVLKRTTSVPEYQATFWIGTHFPDIPSWLGVPNFDTAYMYVDWVKITSYDDPTIDECGSSTAKKEWSFVDLGNAEIPHTDYIINGDFSRLQKGTADKALGWEEWLTSNSVCGSENYVGYLQIDPDSLIYQTVDSKYKGHKLKLVVTAEKISGDGGLNAYLEEYYGIMPRGKSEVLTFRHKMSVTKELEFELQDLRTNSLRVCLQTDEGTTVRVTSVKMYLA